MRNDLAERVLRAVEARKKFNTRSYDDLALPDEQELGPPASVDRLQELEQRLGSPLPPSFRCFLEHHDGWRMAAGGADLLSVVDIDGGRYSKRIERWRQQARTSGDDAAARGLVIGVHSATATIFYLDAQTRDAAGEWAMVLDHNGEEERWGSFLAWLERSEDVEDEEVDFDE